MRQLHRYHLHYRDSVLLKIAFYTAFEFHICLLKPKWWTLLNTGQELERKKIGKNHVHWRIQRRHRRDSPKLKSGKVFFFWDHLITILHNFKKYIGSLRSFISLLFIKKSNGEIGLESLGSSPLCSSFLI